MTKFIYLISGSLIMLLGILLFSWGYSNSSFPEIENTNKIIGKVSDIEIQGWKVDFKTKGESRKFSYFRHYGNYDIVKDMLSRAEQPMIEMIVQRNDMNSAPIIYQIVIDGKKVTNFEEKKSKHGDYTKSIYWFAIGLIFIGAVGLFMGLRVKLRPEESE